MPQTTVGPVWLAGWLVDLICLTVNYSMCSSYPTYLYCDITIHLHCYLGFHLGFP